MKEKKPWLKFYANIPEHIDYPNITIYKALKIASEKTPDSIAYDYLGSTDTYGGLIKEVDFFAQAFSEIGMKKGDRAIVALPNCPQAVISFYALNKIGVVSTMIHPLSASKEFEFFINDSGSKWAIIIDLIYSKFQKALENSYIEKMIVTRASDYFNPLLRMMYNLSSKKQKNYRFDKDKVVNWKDLRIKESRENYFPEQDFEEMAVILYSGGTTGNPKGIMLSNKNFIALGKQLYTQKKFEDGESILAILPVFHGFGLGICINAILMNSGKCILVPKFTVETVAKIIKKKRPNMIAGVPTLFKALSSNKEIQKADLSCLRGVFCGGDSLSVSIKEDFEKLVKFCNGSIEIREGYGLTETVSACTLMPENEYREKSVGIPFPDMAIKIVKPETLKEAETNEDGEICIKGPTMMMGYLNHPEETEKVIKKHDDGYTWLHTGDIGSMDEDGFIYFKLRSKRMIKSSGISVYPSQVEEVLNSHPEVLMSCVIGVPDDYQIQKVKAFVSLRYPEKAGKEMEDSLLQYCGLNLLKWSIPSQIEFRKDFPKTLIGKVSFKELEKEEAQKNK